jgi:hypothetical protein
VPLLLAAWLGPAGRPAGGAPTAWLTGDALRARLARPENVFWQEETLRDALLKFCRAQQVAFLLDRRVDPGQGIDGAAESVPVGGILAEVAESRKLGLTFFGPVAYLGPPDVAARLRTLAEMRHVEMRRLPAADAAKLAQSRSFAWDDFATPRQLLERLAEEGGFEIAGLERIPHDLWAAADLPPLPLVDRITLLAIQFDLTFTISADGRRVTLVPVSDEVAIVRSYPAGRTPRELVDQWQALAPECQIRLSGGKIWVKGRLEDIESIEALRQPAAKTAAAPPGADRPAGETRFTGRVVNKPLGDVLEYVGSQFGLELKIDRQALARAGVSLDRLVSFSVKDAGVDDLLKAVLEPVGCTFRRQDKTIEIKPAE